MSLSVLIVDDMEEMRGLLRDVLKEHPEFRIAGEAGDGREAIDLAEATKPDLILLDLSMPRMDGLEALGYLRRVSPASRIVVLSGFDEETMGPRAVGLGALAYLAKGVTPDTLVKELLRVAHLSTNDGH